MEEGSDDALLWGIALLHDRAGDAHRAHQIARGRLSDWFAHYPAGDWNGPWEIGFPRPYHSIVQKESLATGVPEWFIYGVMREESTFMPRVVSHANAYGLMQIIPPTARGIGKAAGLPYSPEALKRPPVNIAIGSRVLENLGRRFKKNPWLAIPGYNAGPGRPARWLRERPNVDFDVWVEMIPFRETRRYTKRVLASRAAYAFVYYRQDAQTALVLPERLTVN
jgi:soluble lytic murein transglycosylase